MGEFGEKFRKAREAKSLSLDDVSNVTKIGSRMLQAIEQENFDQLPGGVFNKGFIRAYAKHLGLNDEEAVTDYLTCLRQAQVDAHEVWDPVPPKPAAAPPPAPAKRPLAPYRKPTLKAQPSTQVEELPELQLPRAEDARPPRNKFLTDRGPAIPWSLLAVAAVVIVLAGVLWTRHSRNSHTQAADTPPPAPSAQSTPMPNAAVNQSSTSQLTAPAPLQSNPSPTAKPSAPPAPTTEPPASQVKSPAAERKEDKKPQDQNKDRNEDRKNNEDRSKDTASRNNQDKDVIVRTFPPAKPAPDASSAARMTLVIRATETSWISVTADGQPATYETLIAPAHTSIRGTRQIVVKIGNAAGVTFLWNGQEIPAQGAESEVKTLIFDASGMRVLP